MTLAVDIRHDFGGFSLDAKFDAPRGITALFGRSGSGKTSIVRSIAGLIKPVEGIIRVDDRVLQNTSSQTYVPAHLRRMGYVFQDARLFPHKSVRSNLMYGAQFAKGRTAAVGLDDVVELLGLGALLDRHPRTLSGGEAQRVAIGRALLSAPEMILADEPLASLDEARKAEILPYFEALRDETQIPILYVSHSVSEVARLATTVVVLKDGRVIAQGDAATVLGDARVLPTGVRDAGALLEAHIVQQHEDGLTELEAGGVPLFLPRIKGALREKVRVRIAAQDVILAKEKPDGLSALNIIPGRVRSVRIGDGPGAIVTLETPAGAVLARVTRRSVVRMGLGEGASLYAVVKTVSVAPSDVSGRV